MFDRVTAIPAYRIVYEAIEKQILSGRLDAGDQLPTETDLAEQFGLARHTVREGLRLLEDSGLVRREGGGGFSSRRRTTPSSRLAPHAP